MWGGGDDLVELTIFRYWGGCFSKIDYFLILGDVNW